MASRKDPKGRVLRKGEGFSVAKNTFYYCYTDPFGKRRYIYSKDIVLLREKEEELKRDQLDGLDVYVAGNSDLNFMFDRYMSTKTDLRISTRSNYLTVYDRYVREEFGKKKLREIKYSDILFFYTYLISEKNLQIGTVEYIHRLIRPSLEMAVRDNIIRKNPAEGIIHQLKRKTQSGGAYVRHALTIEQQRAFLQYLNDIDRLSRWSPMFTVMVGTGMRIGELVGLRWQDIDMEARTIDVNHSLYYFGGKRNKDPQKWVVNLPKTKAGTRVIPMVDTVYDAFKQEKWRQEIEEIACVTEVDGMSGFIFCNRFGAINNPESVNKALNRIIEDYNSTEEVRAVKEKREAILLPHFTCHHLRHTFCTRLCEADVNIKVIQSVMGHKDIQTTLDIYAEVSGTKSKKSLNDVFDQMKLF